jgi:hypothetical protein
MWLAQAYTQRDRQASPEICIAPGICRTARRARSGQDHVASLPTGLTEYWRSKPRAGPRSSGQSGWRRRRSPAEHPGQAPPPPRISRLGRSRSTLGRARITVRCPRDTDRCVAARLTVSFTVRARLAPVSKPPIGDYDLICPAPAVIAAGCCLAWPISSLSWRHCYTASSRLTHGSTG